MKNTISLLILVTIAVLSYQTATSKNTIGSSQTAIVTALNNAASTALEKTENIVADAKDTAEKIADVTTGNNSKTSANNHDQIGLEGKNLIPVLSVKVHENPNDQLPVEPQEKTVVADNKEAVKDTTRASLNAEKIKLNQKEVINFAFGSTSLNKNALTTLLKLKNQISTANGIEIQGFTDNIGNSDTNLEISKKRIAAVIKELEKMGVAASKIKTMPMGAANPIASNSSSEGRQANRRVEILLN